ncbi:MAG: hypothetical protein ACI8SR_002481 [Oceanicoccus sp.]|jgi:hypothetical protein
MSQGLFNALFMGAKETESAKKVIKLASYFGFASIALVITILFIPFEPLQDAINKVIPEKGVVIGLAAFFAIGLYFLLKENMWAACIIVALIVSGIIITYISTKEFPSAFECIQLIIYGSAIQAIHFLGRNQKELDTES